MDPAQREYDRFGPWAVEISDDDPMPPLFVPHLTRPDALTLAVKIPRHIERRAAHPGMDLYDYLVCLYEDELLILQRVGREVEGRSCRYQDVQHLCLSRSLLRGNIRLALPGMAYDLPYNTVSDDLMSRLVAIVRQRSDPPVVGGLPQREAVVGPDVLSFYFERLLGEERQKPEGMRLLAAQGSRSGWGPGMALLRRALMRAAGRQLLESMHFSDGRELMILDRGQPWAFRWETVYGVDTWYVPLANIREVTWRDDPANRSCELLIRTAGGAIRQVFDGDGPRPQEYAAFLARTVEASPAPPA